MKRNGNRRVSKTHSVVVSGLGHVGAILGVLFVVVLMNVLAKTSCQQLMKSIGEDRRQLAKLEDARMREATHWEEMKTPEKIEAALLRHGLAMRAPKPEQIVHMRANGEPYAGQISVARARQRGAGRSTAQVRMRR